LRTALKSVLFAGDDDGQSGSSDDKDAKVQWLRELRNLIVAKNARARRPRAKTIIIPPGECEND